MTSSAPKTVTLTHPKRKRKVTVDADRVGIYESQGWIAETTKSEKKD